MPSSVDCSRSRWQFFGSPERHLSLFIKPPSSRFRKLDTLHFQQWSITPVYKSLAGEGNVEVWWLRARCGDAHQVSRVEVFLMIGFLDTTEEYEKADVDEFFGLFLESYD